MSPWLSPTLRLKITNYIMSCSLLPELDLRGLGRCLRQDRPVAATFADRHHRAEDKAYNGWICGKVPNQSWQHPFFFCKTHTNIRDLPGQLENLSFSSFSPAIAAALLKRATAGGWECAGKPTPSSSSPWSLITWTPLPPSSRASQHQPPSAFPRSSLAMFECMSLVADQKNLRNHVQQ